MSDRKASPPGSGDNRPPTLKRAVKANKNVSANLTRLRVLNTCSGAFFGVGAYGLIDPYTILEWIKVFGIGFAGGYAAYTVSHICMTKGVYQAATRVTGAAAASVGTVAATGLTIAAASFTGMTINSIDQMRMQQFGQENSDYVNERINAALHADQVVIAVEAAFDHIQTAAACERESSCVSRVGNGGEGLAFYTLKGVETQIGTVLSKLQDGSDSRDAVLQNLSNTEADVQLALDAVNPSRKSRRSNVQIHLSEQNKALAALDRAQPLSIVAGLAEELQRGVGLPGKPGLSQRISERLTQAASGITKSLEAIGEPRAMRPKLPPETGVSETLGWAGHFLFLAVMLVLIDAVTPLLLWFFTYSALRQTVEPEDEPGGHDPFSFTAVVETPPVQMEPASRPSRRTAGGKRIG